MHVFCFDFDGVICDSAPETALSAWKGCRTLWPEGPAFDEALQQAFARVRPALHTGFEAIPMMRLLEQGQSSEAILSEFPALRDALIAREKLEPKALQKLFGSVRDELIAADRAEWLRWNRFYAGIAEMLRAAIAAHPLYVITTKQERFVTLLCEHNDVELAAERIFGLERNRSKPEILAGLLAEPRHAGATFHFIEDRADTLEDVLAEHALDAVRLYLADWGYNTPQQRQWAAGTGRVEVVSVPSFRALHGLSPAPPRRPPP